MASAQAPVIGADGTIYAVNRDLFAVRPDGSVKWKWSAGSGYQDTLTQSPVMAADGTIILADFAGALFRLTAEGRQIWTYTAASGEADAGTGLRPRDQR